jgi:hypothetical protein
MMSVNLLLENDTDPVIWRGALIAGTVKQFWTDVLWGDVDYMFVDMPPGTGDVPLTVFQSLPVDGIVIVTSPQDLVSMIVSKAVKMAQMMHIPVLGFVENYSYLECPDCGKKISVFGQSHLDEVAAKFNLPVLARLPIDPAVAEAFDSGLMETVDTAALNEAIAAAEALAEADYSRKSWSNLQTALTAAKDVVADENATQEVVDQAKVGLEAKKAALVNVVAMREAIAAAEAKLAEADKYTDETVAELTTAYNNAVYAINSNIGYVQADADMHVANINNAISALVEKTVEPELTGPAKVEKLVAEDTN